MAGRCRTIVSATFPLLHASLADYRTSTPGLVRLTWRAFGSCEVQLFDLIVTHERLPDTKLRGRHLSAGKYPCPTGNELPQPEFTDPARAVFGMFGAMIFDLAHFDARDHSADFVAEVQRINFSLEAKELAAFTQMTRDLLEHIKKFEDVLA